MTLITFLENIAFESSKVERGVGMGTEKVRGRIIGEIVNDRSIKSRPLLSRHC